MIPCRISSNLTPLVDLEINDKLLTFVLDTGFNGQLEFAITPDVLTELGAQWFSYGNMKDPNGKSEKIDVYTIEVLWDGENRSVFAYEIKVPRDLPEGEIPANLVGTRMLDGHYLALEVREGGQGSITALPQ